MRLKESFKISSGKSKLIVPNKSKEHLDFTHNEQNDHILPFDEQHFLKHEPIINDIQQKNAIDDYKLSSRNINRSLFGVEKASKTNEYYIGHISDVLKSSPKAIDDFHVYTGINSTRAPTKGDIHIPAFTSTSTSIHRAAKFVEPNKNRHTEEYHPDENGNMVKHTVHHILKVNVKKGQQVGAYVANHSNYAAENEFLINKGHTIHISGNHEDHYMPPHHSSKDNNPRIYRVHHATITPDAE